MIVVLASIPDQWRWLCDDDDGGNGKPLEKFKWHIHDRILLLWGSNHHRRRERDAFLLEGDIHSCVPLGTQHVMMIQRVYFWQHSRYKRQSLGECESLLKVTIILTRGSDPNATLGIRTECLRSSSSFVHGISVWPTKGERKNDQIIVGEESRLIRLLSFTPKWWWSTGQTWSTVQSAG